MIFTSAYKLEKIVDYPTAHNGVLIVSKPMDFPKILNSHKTEHHLKERTGREGKEDNIR